MHRSLKKDQGWVLPMVFIMIVLLFMLLRIPTPKFHRGQPDSATNYYIDQSLHGLGASGNALAKDFLLSPSDPASKHVFSYGTSKTISFTENGAQVKVEIQDTKMSRPK